MRITSRSILSLVFGLLVLPHSVAADPTSPVTVERPPEGVGDAFVPGTRTLEDLSRWYVEDEYLVSGNASVFNYGHNPPLGPTDIVPILPGLPYTTRMIVRRPNSSGPFNGTVVIEWWNSTAGFDTAPVWDTSAEYFARAGIIYVGVTNSTTSLAHLKGGCRTFGVLPPTCGSRYAAMSLFENGQAFEMMTQIANLLRSESEQNPLPQDFDVERIYHAGQSQQGGSIVTYASSFHDEANDGYFIQQAATARPINFFPACGATGALPYPRCTPRLVGTDNLVRSDLPVPVVHAITETDIEVLFGTVGRQPDTENFRYYEIAGGSHLTVHDGVELLPAGIVGPDALGLSDLCLNDINSTADGPIFVSYAFNALWANLDRQVQVGRRPPHGRLMEVDSSGLVVRDAFGNGLGGVRLPGIEVPTATYTPGNVADPTLPLFLQSIGNLACFLASSVAPFDPALLLSMYPANEDYVTAVTRSANNLQMQGLLLNADAEAVKIAALNSGIGCGLGFELVFVLPVVMRLRRGLRRR